MGQKRCDTGAEWMTSEVQGQKRSPERRWMTDAPLSIWQLSET